MAKILTLLAPLGKELVAVVIESKYKWYCLVDGLFEDDS